MDYSGPPSGPRRQNGYDTAYYSEAARGAYSQLFPASRPLSAFCIPLETFLAP